MRLRLSSPRHLLFSREVVYRDWGLGFRRGGVGYGGNDAGRHGKSRLIGLLVGLRRGHRTSLGVLESIDPSLAGAIRIVAAIWNPLFVSAEEAFT